MSLSVTVHPNANAAHPVHSTLTPTLHHKAPYWQTPVPRLAVTRTAPGILPGYGVPVNRNQSKNSLIYQLSVINISINCLIKE